VQLKKRLFIGRFAVTSAIQFLNIYQKCHKILLVKLTKEQDRRTCKKIIALDACNFNKL